MAPRSPEDIHPERTGAYTDLAIPTTPHARRAPALPVVLLNSCAVLPRSSMSAWIYPGERDNHD